LEERLQLASVFFSTVSLGPQPEIVADHASDKSEYAYDELEKQKSLALRVMFYLFVIMVISIICLVSQLNGNNGSWTNTDDLAARGKNLRNQARNGVKGINRVDNEVFREQANGDNRKQCGLCPRKHNQYVTWHDEFYTCLNCAEACVLEGSRYGKCLCRLDCKVTKWIPLVQGVAPTVSVLRHKPIAPPPAPPEPPDRPAEFDRSIQVGTVFITSEPIQVYTVRGILWWFVTFVFWFIVALFVDIAFHRTFGTPMLALPTLYALYKFISVGNRLREQFWIWWIDSKYTPTRRYGTTDESIRIGAILRDGIDNFDQFSTYRAQISVHYSEAATTLMISEFSTKGISYKHIEKTLVGWFKKEHPRSGLNEEILLWSSIVARQWLERMAIVTSQTIGGSQGNPGVLLKF